MCLGASNSRRMRICSSVGSVTVADPLLVTFGITFLLLEVVQHCVELIEPLGPRALVTLDPVVDGLERLTVQPVEALPALVADVDRPDLSEHAQVLRHLWLGQPEQAHEVVHGTLPAGEEIEDLPPPWLSHRVERIRCRRCPCHGKIIYLYGNMSIDPTAAAPGGASAVRPARAGCRAGTPSSRRRRRRRSRRRRSPSRSVPRRCRRARRDSPGRASTTGEPLR